MIRLVALGFLAVLLLLPACGTGAEQNLGCCRNTDNNPIDGGGGDDAAGNVLTVVREGQDVPAPELGVFGAISSVPLMDVAVHEETDPGFADNPFPGVYCCFVVPFIDEQSGRTLDVLYVRQPDGVLVRVIGVGEDLPGTGGAVLASFESVWMCPEGTVVFGCAMTGSVGGSLTGLFSRQVFGGGVGDLTKLLIHLELPAGMESEILSFDFTTGVVTQPLGLSFLCRFYILLQNEFSQSVLYAINTDGGAGFPVLSPVTTLVQNLPVVAVEAFGISNDGVLLAAAVSLDREFEEPGAIVSTRTLNLQFDYRIVAEEGDEFATGFPAPGVVGEVYDRGPILVTSDGAIVWTGLAFTPFPVPPGTPTDVILLGQEEGNALKMLARSGAPALPGTIGTFGAIDILPMRVIPENGLWPVLRTDVVGDPAVLQAIYAVDRPDPADPATYVEVALPGDAAAGGVLDGAFEFGSVLSRDASRRTSTTAFRDTLTGGTSAGGLFRTRPDGVVVSIALEGDAIPDEGVRFGPITAQTSVETAVLFRAVVLTSTSGIFLEIR